MTNCIIRSVSTLIIFLSLIFHLNSNAQIFNEWRWKSTVTTGAWEVNTNWEVWNGSAWVLNSTATYPSTNTQTVTVDLTGISGRTITVNNSVSNLASLTIINTSATSPFFTISNLNTLGVVGSFSIGGTTASSITLFCSTMINGPYGGSYQQNDGGGYIAFRPVASSTLIPVFNNVKFLNVGLIAAGIGAVSITENNLSPQSFSHNSGDFFLNGNTINCRNSFNIEPIPTTALGFANILGSTINAGNLTLSSTANFSFQAQTTNIFLTDNTSFGICTYRFKGDQASAGTCTLNSVTFNNIGSVSTVNWGSSNKIVTNTINSSKSLWFGGGISNIFRFKNFNLTQPLSIVITSDYSPQIADVQSITTAPSTCPAAYNFIGDLHGGQRSLMTLGVPGITVNYMNFHNMAVSGGSVTTTNAVDMGFNSGVIFSTPIPSGSVGATTVTWNGSVSTDWFNANNWTPSTCIPSILDNVIIPAGTPNLLKIEQPAFCYNLTTTGAANISTKPYTLPSLTIGGDFIRSVGSNFSNYFADIFLSGIKPATNYNITSASGKFPAIQYYINADTTSTYNLTDSLTVDYPGTGNFRGIYHLSGGFKTNGKTVNTNVLSLYADIPYYRKFDITGSRINVTTHNLFTNVTVFCPTTLQFKTTGSRFFFSLDMTYVQLSTILHFIYLPANNTRFNLHRVTIKNHPTRSGEIYINTPGPNTSIGGGLHIDSLEANGNFQLGSNATGNNLLDIDTLIVKKGYEFIGVRNNSITINNKILSNSDCTGAFTIKSNLPGTSSANNFYINTTGGIPSYTLQNWNIDAVRVNQATAGTPPIFVNNGYLTANTGTTLASGWNNNPASPKTFFWIGEGSSTNWDDVNNWSYSVPTNGADPSAGCLPGKDDNIYFKNMSFYGAAGGSVAVTSSVSVNISANFKNMFWQGDFTTTNTGTVALNPVIKETSPGLIMNGYGSIYMHKTMKWNFGGIVNFYSDTISQIEIQNNVFKENIFFKGNGKYTVVDSLYLSVHPASTFGGVYQEAGELNLNGNKLVAKCYNSPPTAGTKPIKFNIANSKVKFVQQGCGQGDFMFGNPPANTFTFITTNSQISIFPVNDYYAYMYNTGMYVNSPVTLTFNVVNISSTIPGGTNTDYGIIIYDKGINVDSLIFDVNATSILNVVTTATNNINYLKYKLGSTNNITAGATMNLKELNAKSTCDPITIQSTVPGTYAKICPSTSTPLQAQETSLKYINSACGSFVSPFYSQAIGGQSAFTPAGAANVNGWTINNATSYLGFINPTPSNTVINCSSSIYTIGTTGFNISPSSTYTWSTPTGSLTGLGATSYTSFTGGTYTLGVTYKVGCTVTDVFTLSINNNLASSLTSTNVNCNGFNNGSTSISITPTLNTSGYNYLISPGNYTNSTGSTFTAGIYSYTVSNPLNPTACSVSNTFTITQPPVINSTLTAANVLCYGNNTGSIIAIGGGGTPGYTYSLSSPSSTVTTINTSGSFGGLNPGTSAAVYTVITGDSQNCPVSVKIVTLTQASDFTVSASSSSISCFGGTNGSASVTVNGATPGYSYTWSGNSSTSNVANNLSSGNYTVTINDLNNCSISQSFTITQPTTSIAIASTTQNNLQCNGDNTGVASATATGGSPGYTYSWLPGTITSLTNTATGLASGNYTLLIADANNCATIQTFSLTQPNILSVAITSTTQPACGVANGQITSVVNGGTSAYTYSWTSPSPGTTFTTSSATSSNLAAGVTSLTIIDANGCVTQTFVTLTNPNAPVVAVNFTNVPCFGMNNGSAAATVTAPGTYTYNWSNSSSTSTISNLSPGIYSVTVTDVNSCISIQTVSINQPLTAIALTVNNTAAVNCSGQSTGAATVNVNGGTPVYSYTWFPSGGNTNVLTGAVAGNYTVTAKDNNGCTTNSVITITESASLTIATSSSIQPTCQNNNGSVSIQVSGGTPVYTYSWSTGETTNTLSGISDGSYTVTITDALGCKQTATTTLECKIELIIPTLVTPNNDGKNDTWKIKGLESYPNAHVKIFNRWGNLLFEEGPYLNKFDGVPNSGVSLMGANRIPSATYFFVLDLGDGSKPINSYFELQD